MTTHRKKCGENLISDTLIEETDSEFVSTVKLYRWKQRWPVISIKLLLRKGKMKQLFLDLWEKAPVAQLVRCILSKDRCHYLKNDLISYRELPFFRESKEQAAGASPWFSSRQSIVRSSQHETNNSWGSWMVTRYSASAVRTLHQTHCAQLWEWVDHLVFQWHQFDMWEIDPCFCCKISVLFFINHTGSNTNYLCPVNSRVIDKMLPKHKTKVLEKISDRLPLSVTANLIHDEGYWKRCCKGRWEVCDVVQYGNSWKRMFFERFVHH